ncbi:MAG: hypothetical protein GY873_30295 [Bosea sp.]|uniref:hypothetical protein n=1 Tax=Bosea sp. (in: a-proteobacteria) TaxID=1871050 RepID=UPI00238A8776|nr:hypothetical protein [Bosea sp. (in: a-proteobacteria)]MCP4738487.1 hypothetical protein [Bosea sp. (in: a-proteobacteria)]
MNTPRTAIIEIAVPGHVSDQELANRLHQVLRRACMPAPSEALRLFYPDPASLEVTVYGVAAADLLQEDPADGP